MPDCGVSRFPRHSNWRRYGRGEAFLTWQSRVVLAQVGCVAIISQRAVGKNGTAEFSLLFGMNIAK
jgi:hypothetical protein